MVQSRLGASDGVKSDGGNYKGRKYARSLVQIESQLKRDVKAASTVPEQRVASEDASGRTGS